MIIRMEMTWTGMLMKTNPIAEGDCDGARRQQTRLSINLSYDDDDDDEDNGKYYDRSNKDADDSDVPAQAAVVWFGSRRRSTDIF